jgi:hypothetical protein
MSTKTEQYVINNYDYAKKAGERFKMDPLVILAQGSFESGWGTSNLSKNYNNYFGKSSANLFYYSGSSFNTLSSWISSTGKDSASRVSNPFYTSSEEDLRNDARKLQTTSVRGRYQAETEHLRLV